MSLNNKINNNNSGQNPNINITERKNNQSRLFASFDYKNFQFFWSGAFLSNIGTWMQTIALNWFVFSITNSAFYLGLVNFSSNIPIFLLVLFAGVTADNVNRKKLIIWTQTAMMILAFILGVLVSIKHHNIHLIIIITIGSGIMNAIGIPAWQAFVSDIVPKENLLNAIALNSAQFHTARLLGPALAGLVLGIWGPAYNFYINSVSFLAVIIAFIAIKEPYKSENSEKKDDMLTQLKNGFTYTKQQPIIINLLLATGIMSFFALSYIVLMPIIAKEILKSDARGFGFLMSANGLGAVIGSLITAYFSKIVRKDIMICTGTVFLGIFIFFLALSKIFWLSMVILVVIGTFFLITISSLNTSIQELTPHDKRGRIMSMFAWMFMGIMPFGALFFGTIAQKFSTPIAIAIAGSVTFLFGIILIFKPSLVKTGGQWH